MPAALEQASPTSTPEEAVFDEPILSVEDAITMESLALSAEIEKGKLTLTRDEYVSVIGNVAIDTHTHPKDLPAPIADAWGRSSRFSETKSDTYNAKGLVGTLEKALGALMATGTEAEQPVVS